MSTLTTIEYEEHHQDTQKLHRQLHVLDEALADYVGGAHILGIDPNALDKLAATFADLCAHIAAATDCSRRMCHNF